MVEGNPQTAGASGASVAAGTSGPVWLRPLIAISAVVVVLTVVSTAAVLVLGGPRQASYAPGSPEDAFQRFVAAAYAGDYQTADSYLSQRLIDQGTSTRLMVSHDYGVGGNRSWTIDSAQRRGDTATLYVKVETRYQSGLVSTTSSYTTDVQMAFERGGWRVDSSLYGI